jgi:hypothetical protein
MVPSDKISRHLGLHGTEHQQLRPTAGSDGASDHDWMMVIIVVIMPMMMVSIVVIYGYMMG